jgi:hypothetical protein
MERLMAFVQSYFRHSWDIPNNIQKMSLGLKLASFTFDSSPYGFLGFGFLKFGFLDCRL